jgi:hypothetical protein
VIYPDVEPLDDCCEIIEGKLLDEAEINAFAADTEMLAGDELVNAQHALNVGQVQHSLSAGCIDIELRHAYVASGLPSLMK